MTALSLTASKQVMRQSKIPLGMTQLVFRGLAEDWLAGLLRKAFGSCADKTAVVFKLRNVRTVL